MKALRIFVAILLVVPAASCAAPGDDPPGPVLQPEEVPGSWKLVELPFPPLRQIANRMANAKPVYGLYSWAGELVDNRESIRKIGWKSVRIGGPMTDKAMTVACEDAIEVYKTLGLRVHGERRNRTYYDSDEAFLKDNVAGMVKQLERYGPGGSFFKDHPKTPKRPITLVEIWNEPNFQYMIPPRVDVKREVIEAEREALYAKVLIRAYEAIKHRWPNVTVVGFGAGGALNGDLRFIQHVHENDPAVASCYDALSTHPYIEPVAPDSFHVKKWGGYDVPSSLKALRDILARHGRKNVPIWYSEVGWPISQADGGRFATKPGRAHVSPLLQAAYVCRMYALSMRLGVERTHIMYVTDSDNFNAGFFLGDKSWRPSAYAVQNMIRLLPNPQLASVVHDGKDGLFAYGFVPTGTAAKLQAQTIMAWNVAGPKRITLPVKGSGAEVVDLFGHKKTLSVKDGKVLVEVGPCPVYVVPR